MSRQNAVTVTPPNLNQQPTIEFRKNDFDASVWLKGYRVFIEKAVRCPCEGQIKNALTSCTNCHGVGFFFINPIETRALTTSINRDHDFAEWSPEIIGNISISVRDDLIENLSFYDKITFKDKEGFHSEVLTIRNTGAPSNQDFVFLIYRPLEILDVWIFNGSANPLIRIPAAQYAINSTNPYIVNLNITSKPTNFNGVVAIRYRHEIQYNVIDLRHEIRSSNIRDTNGRLTRIDLPINAIARRSHLLLAEIPNYDGTGIQNNSYNT